jgi:hypothetical protein
MINWIEATEDNFIDFCEKEYCEDTKNYQSLEEYVFLTENQEIVNNCRVCIYTKIPFDSWFYDITHFALRTEYEAILPKETK